MPLYAQPVETIPQKGAPPKESPSPQGAPPPGGTLSLFLPLILVGVLFFFLFYSQRRQEKKRRQMLASLKKGDKVLTSGGIYGVVLNVKKEEKIVILKIADNVKVEVSLNAVEGVVGK